jgi:tRNA threonylcarbamoyladenosine biosynthesis protein TsaB
MESLCDQIKEPVVICGEIKASELEMIRRKLGPAVIVPSPAATLRRAAYLAELGWQRLARGDADDAATLSAIYLHNPQIDI